jgi:hypothetical protein
MRALDTNRERRYTIISKRESGGIGEKPGSAPHPADIRAGITAVNFFGGISVLKARGALDFSLTSGQAGDFNGKFTPPILNSISFII